MAPTQRYFIIIVIIVSRTRIVDITVSPSIELLLISRTGDLVKVLEYVRLLVGGVVPDILLDGFDLLDQVELVFLGQVI